MLAICAYYDGIMLNAFAIYYAHNYAGIIGSSLPLHHNLLFNLHALSLTYKYIAFELALIC